MTENKPSSIEEKVTDAMMFGMTTAYEMEKRQYDKESTIRELRKELGEDKISTNEAVLASYSKNIMSWKKAKFPDVVAQPETTEDVQTIMKICNKYRCPVTVQGGGTGFNITIAYLGGLLLDTARMRKIWEINKDADFAVIEPGVSYAEFLTELHRRGYTFPHGTFPPMTKVISNLLGIHGLHRAHLYNFLMVSAQVVLADGSMLILGSDSIPDWTQGIHGSPVGPDFLGLFRRSAGTLGIITRASVRIFRRLEAERLLVYGFSKYPDAVDFVMHVCRNWLAQDILGFLWTWPMNKKHRVQVTNQLCEDSGKAYPLDKPPKGVPYTFMNILVEGIREDVEFREALLDKLSRKFKGRRIPEKVIRKKWPWYWKHIEDWWLKDMPIFLEPYVNVQGTSVPFYSIIQGPTRAKNLEHYLVHNVLQKLENEHPQWTGASGYLSWPFDNGRRWFIRCLSWFQDYSDKPEEFFEMRTESDMTIMPTYMPEMIAKYYYQGSGLPLSMELVTVGAALEPTSAKLWLKIKKAMDPNNILNPYVTAGIEKVFEKELEDKKAQPDDHKKEEQS